MEEACLSLTSPEAEAIVRQIYAAELLADKRKSLGLIRKELQISFSLYTDLPEGKLTDSANLLFDALVMGCEHALAIDSRVTLRSRGKIYIV